MSGPADPHNRLGQSQPPHDRDRLQLQPPRDRDGHGYDRGGAPPPIQACWPRPRLPRPGSAREKKKRIILSIFFWGNNLRTVSRDFYPAVFFLLTDPYM